MELENSFWPRKRSLSEARSALQVVHEEEAVGFPGRLLVHPVQLVLRQQGAQLFDDVQLVLVAQPPAGEELRVDPHG